MGTSGTGLFVRGREGGRERGRVRDAGQRGERKRERGEEGSANVADRDEKL